MNDYQPSPTWVPIGKIQPPYYYGVREYRRTNEDIDALTEHIELHGIKNPLITNAGLELVSGTRRLAAAQRLGMTEVPVIARDNADLVNALLYDHNHPAEPSLVQPTNYQDKLKHGLLMHRMLDAYFKELKGQRISRNQKEARGAKYTGPPIPEFSAESLLPIIGMTAGRWITLRFLSCGVGATAPVNPRTTFHHKADRAEYWLKYADETGMLDKAHVEYTKECRPAGWVEPPRTRTHPSDAPVTASPERFLRTMERSAAILNSTITNLKELGGVPDKVTHEQVAHLVAEFNHVVRDATFLRKRLNSALATKKHGNTKGVTKS